MLILTTAHQILLWINFLFFILFYPFYISACGLASVVGCLWFQEVNLCACEHKVKEN